MNMEINSINKPFGELCPTIGHIHVAHTSSKVEQNSRYYANEANAIAKWLADNIHYIEKVYAKKNLRTGRYEIDLQQTIVIITPFQAQKSVLRYALNLAARNYGVSELRMIPCITIYELLTMGRRNNIIVFSTVYGANEDWGFFRDGKDVLDVAFSWAKDYFFVFGERNIQSVIRDNSKSIQEFMSKTMNFIPDDVEKTAMKATTDKGEKRRKVIDKELGACLTEHLRNMGIKVVTDKNEFDRVLQKCKTITEEEARTAPDGDFEVL